MRDHRKFYVFDRSRHGSSSTVRLQCVTVSESINLILHFRMKSVGLNHIDSQLQGAQNFCLKICIKNQQNARILHGSCPKNYQNTRFFMIFARKIYKIPEFLRDFCPKIPEFYIIIARKIFFTEFQGGGKMPENMYKKITKCPNFTRFLPEKLSKYPIFYDICQNN